MLVVWQEALFAVAVCLALVLAGLAVLRALLGRVSLVDAMALGFPVGAGLLTWLLFLVSWGGIRLTLASVAIAWCLLLTAGLVGRVLSPRDRRKDTTGDLLDRRPTELAHQELALLTVILLVATACAARLGIGRSYSGWDDMAIWSVKGYGIAREGSIWAAGQWGDHGLGYPLNIPLLITIFRMGGDALPASKLIFPLFYLSACAGCLRFWLQRGVATRTAILGAIGLATTPIVFEHATLGYANLPYATYLLLAVGESTQGIMTRDARRQALGGVLFGLAAWTRPEGFLVIGLVMLVMAVVAWRIRPGGLRLVAWISAAVVLAGSWSLFVRLHAPGGQMVLAVRAAVQGWGQGDLHLGALLYIARFMGRQAFEFAVWGMLPFVCLGLMLLGVRKLGPRSNPDVFLLSAVLIMAAAGIMVQFYLADFIGQLVNYLGNSANRMYLPVAVMAVLLVLLLTRATHPTGPSPDVPGTRDGGASLATSTDA